MPCRLFKDIVGQYPGEAEVQTLAASISGWARLTGLLDCLALN